jgi:hypothetical protein
MNQDDLFEKVLFLENPTASQGSLSVQADSDLVDHKDEDAKVLLNLENYSHHHNLESGIIDRNIQRFLSKLLTSADHKDSLSD